MARQGAPQGTVLIADCQTGGRGRMGRSFLSPAGTGIYLSVILRPACPPSQLMHLTCAAAVVVCDAVEKCAHFRPGVKWINDLVYDGRKLGGILTELAIDAETGLTDYAIIGIGINCSQKQGDFPAGLQDMAGSLKMVTNADIDRAALSAAIVEAIWRLDILDGKAAIMKRYRADCITLGQDIAVHRSGTVRHGKALDLDENGGLLVAYPDGTAETVNSGEVSVRGLYGYVS